jgi:two-component system nitrate/nitrite response regulator NarL
VVAIDRRTRVLVADGHPLFLQALVGAIRQLPELELAGAAADGVDAIAGIEALRPDVAVLDVRLRGLSGQKVLELARAKGVRMRIIFLSAHLESDLIYAALAGGAAGYLSKNADREAICDAVVAVARGEIVLSPAVQGGLVGAIRARDAHDRPVLTARERAVLALAAEGCTTAEIAARLRVASATVKTHLQHVYEKLDARDRTGAVAAAMRRGLLE